jgi:hypothetical protein
MDPRIAVSTAVLHTQFATAQQIVALMAKTAGNKRLARYNFQLVQLLDAVESADAPPTSSVMQTVHAIAAKLQAVGVR